MNKKLEAAANEYCKKQNLMWDFVNDLTNKDAVKSFIAGASYGRKEALIEAIEICNNNLGKYPVDIFRPLRSNEENVSIDRISAQMARHILILIRKELEQLLSKE